MKRLTITTTAALSMLLLGATPSTRPSAPTTKPAKTPVPASWVLTNNSAYHFHYRVPPQWRAMQQSDTTTVFRLGSAGKMPPGLFTVIVGTCHESTTEADAAEERKAITTGHPNAKMVKDEAATLGDRPAWLLAYDDTQTMTVTRRGGSGPPQNTEIHTPWKVIQVSRVEGNLHYYVSFEAGTAAYASNLATAQQVIDSFTWSPPPAK